MTRFLVDAQLPPALARWLTGQGHGAEHVADRGLSAADDSTLWSLAISEGLAIITKDEDFAQRRILSGQGPVIVWIRLRNTSRAELLGWFGAVLPGIIEAIQRGETLIEVA